MINKFSVPAKPRSRYRQNGNTATGGSSSSIYIGGGASSGMPYSTNPDGSYSVSKSLHMPSAFVGDEEITSEKTISWDEAVTAMHEHSNKSNLDSINQDLGTGSSPLFQNISVAGNLNCYALVANQVRSTNGLLYVTDGAEVKGIGDEDLNSYLFTDSVFEVGDYILSQKGTAPRKLYKVTDNLDGGEYALQCIEGGSIESGDYFVRVDSTDADRRTGILLSPYTNSYIDFYTGDGLGGTPTVNTSIGWLDHLGRTGISGFGILTDNAWLVGKFVRLNKAIEVHITNDDFDDGIDIYKPIDVSNNNCYIHVTTSDDIIAGGIVHLVLAEGVDDGSEIRTIIYGDTTMVDIYIKGAGGRIWAKNGTTMVNNEYPITSGATVMLNLVYCSNLHRPASGNFVAHSGWVAEITEII